MKYYRPQTVKEAVYLIEEDAFFIAGGTDLGVLMADSPKQPSGLIDLCSIKALSGIKTGHAGLEIGPCTLISDIAASEDLPEALVAGASAIGSPQIRNMATIGGNVCNASPCGDTLGPLLVHDAVFSIEGPKRSRSVEAGKFFTGPKSTILEFNEVLTGISIPAEALENSRSGFRMIGKRNGQVISQVNMAVRMKVADGKIIEIRIAAGSVAPVPLRLKKCESVLLGRNISDLADDAVLMSEISCAAESEVRPISDVRAGEDYRKDVSGALLTEIIRELAAGEQR